MNVVLKNGNDIQEWRTLWPGKPGSFDRAIVQVGELDSRVYRLLIGNGTNSQEWRAHGRANLDLELVEKE